MADDLDRDWEYLVLFNLRQVEARAEALSVRMLKEIGWRHMNDERQWHKSSYSSGAHNCVEVAEGDTTRVRDTQNLEQGYLDMPAAEWNALLSTVTQG